MIDEETERLKSENERLEKETNVFSKPHYTDLGNGKRFAHRHGKEVKYVSGWGWMHYDGKRWQIDRSGEIETRGKETVLGMHFEAFMYEDEMRQKMIVHALKSESDAKIRAMLSLAQSEQKIVARTEDFDRDPMLLNCQNGIIDLRTGELRQHNAEDMITKVVPVEFDNDAKCPTWREFLIKIIPSSEVRSFLHHVIGYTLTGSTREQCLFILYGTGANGKSTFIETIRALLGEYTKVADVSTFLTKQGDRIPNDLAMLAGSRMVSAVEVESGRRLAEALTKQITGGDVITARFLHREYFEFRPQFKLFLATNHKPVIYGTDHAIWRRIHLIPFSVTIPEAEQDKGLLEKLKKELPGILTWAVRGCLSWQDNGLGESEEVREATEGYRHEMDILGQFTEDCCTIGKEFYVTAKNLYAEYMHWCEGNGETPITKKRFGMCLAEKGFVSKSGSNNIRFWTGLKLKEQ